VCVVQVVYILLIVDRSMMREMSKRLLFFILAELRCTSKSCKAYG